MMGLLAVMRPMRCWMPENSFKLFKHNINCDIPVEKVRHDETIGNDVNDEVLDPSEQLYKLFKFNINCGDGA
jgi:hypothetical protein